MTTSHNSLQASKVQCGHHLWLRSPDGIRSLAKSLIALLQRYVVSVQITNFSVVHNHLDEAPSKEVQYIRRYGRPGCGIHLLIDCQRATAAEKTQSSC
ncbi:hypothetical protein AVEN_163771-1 [Araneus ventricosus]|uniref:Uncharacterized protein n=1 Tax=Araneus ventricosus TaxID=182803 RepID=A0A4Y2HN89_ARAVE|nr:hypothetical protein AVEN_163771-1 [Araneus ventricosus]